jgi:small-conductance mechanosensitive channel
MNPPPKEIKEENKGLFSWFIDFFSLARLQVSQEKKQEMYLRLFIILFLLAFKFFYLEKQILENLWLENSVHLLLFYFIIHYAFHIFRIIVVSVYRKKNKFPADYRDNFVLGIDKLFFLVVHFIFLFSILFFFGIDIVRFLTTLGLFSVAIAWVFKEKIANAIDGIVIMFSEDLRLKDYIQVGEYNGRVLDVNFMNTKMETDDGDYVYVPNSQILNSEFINFSRNSVKRVRVDFSLPPQLAGEIEKLERQLEKQLMKEFNELVKEDSIKIKIQEINENAISLTLQMIVTRYSFKIAENINRFSTKYILKFIDKKKKSLKTKH